MGIESPALNPRVIQPVSSGDVSPQIHLQTISPPPKSLKQSKKTVDTHQSLKKPKQLVTKPPMIKKKSFHFYNIWIVGWMVFWAVEVIKGITELITEEPVP